MRQRACGIPHILISTGLSPFPGLPWACALGLRSQRCLTLENLVLSPRERKKVGMSIWWRHLSCLPQSALRRWQSKMGSPISAGLQWHKRKNSSFNSNFSPLRVEEADSTEFFHAWEAFSSTGKERRIFFQHSGPTSQNKPPFIADQVNRPCQPPD